MLGPARCSIIRDFKIENIFVRRRTFKQPLTLLWFNESLDNTIVTSTLSERPKAKSVPSH